MQQPADIARTIQSLLDGKLLDNFSIGKDQLRGVYADFESGMLMVTDGTRRAPVVAFSSEEIRQIKERLEQLLHNTFHNPLNKKEVN